MSLRPHVDRLFAQLRPENSRTAFSLGGVALTYADLDRSARSFAAGLSSLGVAPGDRVACLVPSSLELVVALFGTYHLGATFVPINTRYRDQEVRHILEDCAPTLVIAAAGTPQLPMLRRLAADGVDVRCIVVGASGEDVSWDSVVASEPVSGPPHPQDEDLALLIYTSGTTGRSKGVELPFRAVVGNIHSLTSLWQWTPDDVLVLALPLFHVHGLCIGVHGTVIQGCSSVIIAKFEPGAVADAIDHGGTIFMGVPTMYALLANAMDEDESIAPKLSKARLLTSGSAALSVNHFERFQRETGHRILERYGMSETLLTLSNPHDGERRRGSVGRPVPGVEARVVNDDFVDVQPGEVGQILVRGQSLFRGYWGQPEKTAESFHDGWFVTGDAAKIAEDGYISIVGRRSTDIIKSGGYKISAREIEEVIECCPGVAEVAVVGRAHEVWGEEIVAYVVRKNEDEKTVRDRVSEACATSLSDYKKVRQVRFVDELPRNALGKIQKAKLP